MADSMDLGSVLLSSASAEAVEKIGATVCTSWVEAVGEKSLVNNVPPSTWCIIETEEASSFSLRYEEDVPPQVGFDR